MKTLWKTLLFSLASGLVGHGAEPSLTTLEQQFRQLPAAARRQTGPLFWLHGDESKERLEMYVGKVAEGGNGCFTTESRPHKDWLKEGWYRDLGICLEAAKRNDLKMWIFDEKWWPSGEAGGLVPERYGSKRLLTLVTNITGPGRFTAENLGGLGFIAAVAGREQDGAIDGSSLQDLSASIHDGTLAWEVPAGNWKVMQFSWKPHKARGANYLVDGASQDCVDWYIRTVYQPHYDRFKEDFGKNIMGFFYDEPETHGDWGTEVMKVLAERQVDWKRALVAWKFKLAGEEQAAARYQYQDALAEAWGRTLYGGLTRWCEEHRVKSIGHWLEHANLYLNQDYCAGNMFRLQKQSSMGAIDAVFAQFKMGQRKANDTPCWQTPKLGSSITHAFGKADDVAMVEIFGARGQDLTYPEMKWWADHMQVSGINFLIPHSFNPRSPRDTDCPPYFYNGGFEPRWPLYRVFADYTSRLSLMLSGGRHVCPVALLFLGGSAHVGKRILPDQLSEALQDALYDCDWLPYEVFEQDMQIAGASLQLRQEAYRVLVVPPVEVIPYATLAKAKAFFEAGGIVVTHGFLPTKSTTLGKTSADITPLREAIWGAPEPGLAVCKTSPAGGRSYLLLEAPTPEQLQRVLAGDAEVHPTLEVTEGETSHWLHVLHRVKSGRDVFFIANQNHQGEPRRFRFRITAEGVPECWDALRNEITAVPFTRQGRTVELNLTLEPNESTLLVFQPDRRALPARYDAGAGNAEKTVAITRDDVPPPPEPKLEGASLLTQVFEGSSWVWFPEGNPAQSAPPGTRYFRKQITLPTDRKITSAVFAGTADNSFTLYINGKETGQGDNSSDGWRNPVELDVKAKLQPGANQLAIAAVNASDQPSPAGLLGCLRVTFDTGEPQVLHVDSTWKCSPIAAPDWRNAEFDDAAWRPAKEVAKFGAGTWGSLRGQLTLSPVKADPFIGQCELPASVDLSQSRVCLEMDDLAPEPAARVTVNGEFAGGLISKPLRLDITTKLKPGLNAIRIEPFAPKAARVRITPLDRPKLGFSPGANHEFSFDTGVLRGKLRPGGKSIGIASVVDVATGLQLDRGTGPLNQYGLCSHYRVFSANHRYGTAAWEWPSEARLQPDGSVEVRWPAAERPFELQASYRWSAPNTLDIETRVEAKTDLPKFESFLASYFAEDFTNSSVYVSALPSCGTKGFMPAERSAGVWQAFPREEAVVSIIRDGRWKLEPHPVDWVIMPHLEKPLGLRRSVMSGLSALLMAPSDDCFAVSTPHQAESHTSMYLSLFGRDLKAGETVRARSRLVIGRRLSEADLVRCYEKYQ